MGLTMVGKILGFGRETVLAAFFGATAATDALMVALTIPAVIFGLVGTSITTVGVPVYSEYIYNEEKREQLSDLIWTTFHAISLLLLFFALLGFLFAPWLVLAFAPGLSPSEVALTVELFYILIPVILFMGLAGWVQGVLNAHGHFASSAASNIPLNLILIGGIILAGKYGDIRGVAVAFVPAVFAQFFIQVPALYRRGVKYRPVFRRHHPAFKKMLLLVAPVLLGTGVGQLNLVVDRILASGLVEGSISAMYYAQRVNSLFQAFFALPLITVLYSKLTAGAVVGDRENIREGLVRGMVTLSFILVPVTVAVLLQGQEMVRIIFERGAFGARDTAMTATALFFYIVGLLFLMWREYITRVFYALGNTSTPMWTGILAVAVNISMSLLLVRYMGLGGLALATSISAAAACIILLGLLRRCTGPLGGYYLLGQFLRVAIAGVLMAVVVWYLEYRGFALPGWITAASGGVGGFIQQVLSLLYLLIPGGLVYLAACRLLGVKDAGFIVPLGKGKRRK